MSAEFVTVMEAHVQACDGVANSGKVPDICGVCGGDGTSCLDCAGLPFGPTEVDQCGDCGGDGTGCFNCTTTNIYDLQTDLDGAAKASEQYSQALVQLGFATVPKIGKKLKKLINKKLAEINFLQNESWVASLECNYD